MNSFSTVFKRRAITLSVVTFCALTILCAIGLRMQRLQIKGVENAGKIGYLLYRGAQPCGEGYEDLGISIVVDLRIPNQ